MTLTGKTTKNNPAAFQTISSPTLLRVLTKTIRKILNLQLKAAINLFKSELMNYLSRYKKNNQLRFS